MRWIVRLVPLLMAATMTAAPAAPRGRTAELPRSRGAPASGSLTEPPTLRNQSHTPHTVEVSLTARPARLPLLPGTLTTVWTYNGTIPGPTLDVYEGDHVIVHFRNELPEPTTVHWHGLNIPADQDGSPFFPIAPGASHDYVFDIPMGTAGTYWYHPHPDGRSGYQVAMGLFGGIIVRSRSDPVPPSVHEELLILSDNRFRPDGSLDFPDPRTTAGIADRENGREGNVLFVNGRIMPTLTIRPGEVQRWRVINASAARVYRLAVRGQTMLQIGTSGGLFERPREIRDFVLANSDRVELLVRGSGAPGSSTALQALPYDRYDPHTRPADWDSTRDLLTLHVADAPPVPSPVIPATLRHIDWLDTSRVAAHRVLVMSQGLLNGRMMDLHRVDFTGKVNTTEIWEVDNVVTMDHPFHLHGFRFQVLDEDGVPDTVPEWKDVINVPKHESVRIVVHYDDFPGKWMYHCHILDHEDMGMMGVLLLQ